MIVPKGTWNTGAIEMKSHVNLVLEEGATLKFAFDTNLYPLVRTSWEGPLAGIILHASMATRLLTLPSQVRVPSMVVVATRHGGL